MKVSREQAALNHERIVDVAARLFRERGYDGIGVADLMKSAGLTHGGFYGHFASKEDLLAQACARAVDGSATRWRHEMETAPEQALQRITDNYLSVRHRDHPGRGCALAALGADVARLDSGARKALTDGAQTQINLLASMLPPMADGAPPRSAAIARYAAMIGAVVLARVVDDTALSEEILQAVAASLGQGEQGGPITPA